MASLLMDWADAPAVEFPEALIDFEAGTWTCSEHGTVMRLDSGLDCRPCKDLANAPPYTPHPVRDSLVG